MSFILYALFECIRVCVCVCVCVRAWVDHLLQFLKRFVQHFLLLSNAKLSDFSHIFCSGIAPYFNESEIFHVFQLYTYIFFFFTACIAALFCLLKLGDGEDSLLGYS